MLAVTYGGKPHDWLDVDDVLTAFDWAVLTKAKAGNG